MDGERKSNDLDNLRKEGQSKVQGSNRLQEKITQKNQGLAE